MIENSSTVLAIVPARGGSKGIPRKNLAPVNGQPLLWWTIEAVRQASEGLRLIVTTDDPEIAELSMSRGATVVERPAELATDESPTEPAMLHVLASLDGREAVDTVVLLQATSPIRHRGTIDRGIRQFRDSGVDSLVAVVEDSPFLWRGPFDGPKPLYAVESRPRRQDLTAADRIYREIGSMYIMRASGLEHTGNRISGRVGLLVLDSDEGMDIDTPSDLIRAQQFMLGNRA